MRFLDLDDDAVVVVVGVGGEDGQACFGPDRPEPTQWRKKRKKGCVWAVGGIVALCYIGGEFRGIDLELEGSIKGRIVSIPVM